VITYSEQLRTKAAWLDAAGFVALQGGSDPFVTLQSSDLRLRFVWDRGQVLAYLAALTDPDRWWNLDFLLEAIHDILPPPEFDLEAVALRLRDSLPELVEALGPNLAQTTEMLERRQRERLETLRTRGPLSKLSEP